MSPTSVNIRCPVRGCRLPLRVVTVDANGDVTCECASGHRKQYTKQYFQRFLSPENVRADLPQACPACHKPIRERSRTAQDYAKEIGRVECSCCQTMLIYNPNTNKWEGADD
ncbi:hypothetical protein KJ836_00155 [Patescibacteria group bacterium]|nr:hypothetical protein [Patescibacteria group bacterium]